MIWARVLELVARLALIDPSITPERAQHHVMAAVLAETKEVPAELLLAVARTESSFDPSWVSRLEDGQRKTGRVRRIGRPVGSGPRFCGPLQTIAGRSWAVCLLQRDLLIGYMMGRLELQGWLARARGDWGRALCGFAGGNRAFAARTCSTYATRVLHRARRIGMPSKKRYEAVRKRRVALIKLLAPDCRCARCEVQCPESLLDIDHVDGRPEYHARNLSSEARIERYWAEHEKGVRLRVLCRNCNKVLGGGLRYTSAERRARAVA